jgi:hypothetical protein
VEDDDLFDEGIEELGSNNRTPEGYRTVSCIKTVLQRSLGTSAGFGELKVGLIEKDNGVDEECRRELFLTDTRAIEIMYGN